MNNTTMWLNLTDVNISNNKIDVLPKKLGAFHCLRRLNLSHNCLSRYSGWVWLKEARIKRTLHFLDISNNSLLEISEYIWSLNALVELKMSHNLLGRLPQGIEKVRNLSILDLSHNMLMYLPAGLTYLRLQTINISNNPLEVKPTICVEKNPSLTMFAATSLQQYCRDKHIIFRWDKLNEYISRKKFENCYCCGNICKPSYIFKAQQLEPIIKIAVNIIRETSELPVVLYEYYCCFPECDEED
ncbi:PREDICTED: leucine-rich repeat-containing protein 57-like [Trachymyrmex cornetzi]|uniref:leucine-rich repeat-containing protein 57-like n=1 Tax=Trachymyrmex cornetzi TaxID=471704 RepID=UPI00084ED3FF|nr:PREDICTED: leucine-rich repeat-containing protein 57-like [Trachymyrmex cornetzi]